MSPPNDLAAQVSSAERVGLRSIGTQFLLLLVLASGCKNRPGPTGPGAAPPSSTVCRAPTCGRLPVTHISQIVGNWCWAAASEMAMKSLGDDVQQCTQANDIFGKSVCCSKPTPKACNRTSWPSFDRYHFSTQPPTCKAAVPFDTLKNEIDHGRPVVFSWLWGDGSTPSDCKSGYGHMMVVTGYDVSSGTPLIFIDDPNPNEDQRRQSPIAYTEFVADPPDHIHWDDYYGIQKGGS